MVDFSKISEIITVLPLLIIYILPGYLFISIKNFITDDDKVEDKNVLIKSIVISYIIINFESVISIKVFRLNMSISEPKNIVFIICSSILITYFYSKFINDNLSDKLLKKLKINRSLKKEVLNGLVDTEKGMWVRVFINTEQIIYQGKLRKIEKITDGNYCIVLSNFSYYKYSGDEIENNEECNTKWVSIFLKDTFRIELIYDSDSKKIT